MLMGSSHSDTCPSSSLSRRTMHTSSSRQPCSCAPATGLNASLSVQESVLVPFKHTFVCMVASLSPQTWLSNAWSRESMVCELVGQVPSDSLAGSASKSLGQHALKVKGELQESAACASSVLASSKMQFSEVRQEFSRTEHASTGSTVNRWDALACLPVPSVISRVSVCSPVVSNAKSLSSVSREDVPVMGVWGASPIFVSVHSKE